MIPQIQHDTTYRKSADVNNRKVLAETIRTARAALHNGNHTVIEQMMDTLMNVMSRSSAYNLLALRCAYFMKQTQTARHVATMGYFMWYDDSKYLIALAKCALDDGHYDDATHIIQFARRQDHRCKALSVLSAEVALAMGNPEKGLRELEQHNNLPGLLHARLLAQSDRLIEAIRVYDVILNKAGVPESYDHYPFEHEMIPSGSVSKNDWYLSASLSEHFEENLVDASIERIGLLQRSGSRKSLLQLSQYELETPAEDERVRLRLAEALLQVGKPTYAIRLAMKDRHHPKRVSKITAHAIILAGATATHRQKLAHYASNMLTIMFADCTTVQNDEISIVARVLRRGVMSILIRKHRTASTGCADPSSSVLNRMLVASKQTLAKAAKTHPEYADVRYHHANCLVAMGQYDDAIKEAGAAIKINPSYHKAITLQRAITQ